MVRRPGVAEQQWRERLRRFGRSDLTVLEFCKREGVSTAAFYSWKRRLRSFGATGRSRPQRRQTVESAPRERPLLFVPVAVPSVSAGVCIELPGGAVVRIPPAADEGLLRCCIRAAAELGRGTEGEAC